MGEKWDKLWEEEGVPVNRELTEGDILEACKAYFAEHGKWPNNKSGDASKYFDFPITWGAIDRQVGSLYQLLIAQRFLREPQRVSEEGILEACKAYFAEHGKYPSAKSGDASKYFGFSITWGGISQQIGSLSQFLRRLKLRAPSAISDDAIRIGIQRYFEDFGKWPNNKSGDASKYFDFPITWSNIFQRTPREHYIPMQPKPKLSLEQLIRAITEYTSEHGQRPGTQSGDASKYFGQKETWGNVDKYLRIGAKGLPKGKSLARLATQEGFFGRGSLLKKSDIYEAAKKYHLREVHSDETI